MFVLLYCKINVLSKSNRKDHNKNNNNNVSPTLVNNFFKVKRKDINSVFLWPKNWLLLKKYWIFSLNNIEQYWAIITLFTFFFRPILGSEKSFNNPIRRKHNDERSKICFAGYFTGVVVIILIDFMLYCFYLKNDFKGKLKKSLHGVALVNIVIVSY